MDAQTLGIIAGIITTLSSAIAVLFKLQTNAVAAQLKTVTEVKDAYKARIDFLETRLDQEQNRNTAAAAERADYAIKNNDKIHDSLKALGAISDVLNKSNTK